eukprot:6111824-Amphidinium_carterae.1
MYNSVWQKPEPRLRRMRRGNGKQEGTVRSHPFPGAQASGQCAERQRKPMSDLVGLTTRSVERFQREQRRVLPAAAFA